MVWFALHFQRRSHVDCMTSPRSRWIYVDKRRRFDLHFQLNFNVVLTSVIGVNMTLIPDVVKTWNSDVYSTSWYLRQIDLHFQHLYNVFSTSWSDVVSTLYRRFLPTGAYLTNHLNAKFCTFLLYFFLFWFPRAKATSLQ